MKKRNILICAVLLCLLLSACGGAPAEVPSEPAVEVPVEASSLPESSVEEQLDKTQIDFETFKKEVNLSDFKAAALLNLNSTEKIMNLEEFPKVFEETTEDGEYTIFTIPETGELGDRCIEFVYMRENENGKIKFFDVSVMEQGEVVLLDNQNVFFFMPYFDEQERICFTSWEHNC